MTAATETKKPSIKVETSDLGDRIKKSMQVDHTTMLGVPTTPVYKEYVEHRGSTIAAMEEAESINMEFVAGTTWALGQIGIEALEANPDANRFSAEIPMCGDNSFKVAVDRSSTGRNPRTGEAYTTYGSIKTEYSQSTGSNRGEMAKVRMSLRELAETALNKSK